MPLTDYAVVKEIRELTTRDWRALLDAWNQEWRDFWFAWLRDDADDTGMGDANTRYRQILFTYNTGIGTLIMARNGMMRVLDRATPPTGKAFSAALNPVFAQLRDGMKALEDVITFLRNDCVLNVDDVAIRTRIAQSVREMDQTREKFRRLVDNLDLLATECRKLLPAEPASPPSDK